MESLLKTFLENNEKKTYPNVRILDYRVDGAICQVKFKHDDSMVKEQTLINVWEVVVFLHVPIV